VEKGLSLMGKITSDQVLTRLEQHSGVEYMVAESSHKKYKDQLREFVANAKDVHKFLFSFKEFAKKLEQIRKMKMLAHSKLPGFLSKFEETTVAVYGLADFSNNRVVSNTDNDSVRAAFEAIPKQIDNPYSKFKHFLKDELVDFDALIETIGQLEVSSHHKICHICSFLCNLGYPKLEEQSGEKEKG
jgi:hypothetical protein